MKDKFKELLNRGVDQVIVRARLEKKLGSGEKLRVKHGIDPTGPNIHIGRAVQLWKLREFQELGHKIILIIGDFTALIGDASDKQNRRPVLTKKQVKENMKNYLPQIDRILDLDKAELRYNSDWLAKLSALELLNLSMKFTAQQMIHRRNFKERWAQGRQIGLHELSYPVLQGYDSVAVKADLEVGGSDQLFNLKAGRKLQEIFKQSPQDIMTTKMLVGLDGRKMSTSWGNVINILDKPSQMFGEIMSMHDEVMPSYFELATRMSREEIRRILKIGPRNAKARLAKEIVALYYGQKAAETSEKEFERVFKEKKLPAEIPQVVLAEKKLNVLDLLVKVKLSPSKSGAKRLVLQKGVKVGGAAVKDWREILQIKKGMIIQAGKRKFVKLG